MMYAVEMTSDGMIFSYISSFMKISRYLQEILTFCLSNLNGCNVGITDGRDVHITSLRWVQVP
jgi:hypothetical protein